MSTPSIRRVSTLAILCAANSQQLIDEYAAECSIPGAEPQHAMYAALEKADAIQCFGLYVADELAGFISVLTSPMPHNGKRVATVESFFVSAPHRAGGSADALLTAAEQHAAERGCLGLLSTAREGSTLEKVLSRRAGYQRSHVVFTKWL